MPRRRPKKGTARPLGEVNRPQANVLQTNKAGNRQDNTQLLAKLSHEIPKATSEENSENCKPSTSDNANISSSSDNDVTAFLQKWKWRPENSEQTLVKPNCQLESNCDTERPSKLDPNDNQDTKENLVRTQSGVAIGEQTELNYVKAKELFLVGVKLEEDELYHESTRYYKQAMRLYPDIEQQIYREQCRASARESNMNHGDENSMLDEADHNRNRISYDDIIDDVPVQERIRQNFNQNQENDKFILCRPNHKHKTGALHISDLPHELIMQIFRYVIGEELDLASLESIGLVCRGFYLLSKDPSLWRSICYSTWGDAMSTEHIEFSFDDANNKNSLTSDESFAEIDWRQLFIKKPRVNYDGVYISRTKYIRQGDVGFQDITYRPFHVIRYYRYLRFFPDKRVLILTTNEEPEKIVPIFRHAFRAKQFSPDLSILEGSFEFINSNQISISAERNCRAKLMSNMAQNQRRQQQAWSRQTPLSQKFDMKFELKTIENKPYRNNVLKWLEYTILTRLETGQEKTTFDLMSETFPNLNFSRVKRFNLRQTNPLSSH